MLGTRQGSGGTTGFERGLTASTPNTAYALRLLAEITRHGSLPEFLGRARRQLDDATVELPRISDLQPWADPARWPITPTCSGTSSRHARTDR